MSSSTPHGLGMVTDPIFYDRVVRLAETTGACSEDWIFCWTEATLLEPGAAGPVRTFAGLVETQTSGWTMPKTIWEILPSLPARDQIPYVEAAVLDPARRMLGREPSGAFEVCLAHAAPGLLRSDGVYASETPLHTGPDYPDHWPLDEFPAAWDLYRLQASQVTPRQLFASKRQDAQDRGVKGYVSLGDLRAFCKRVDAEREAVLAEALRLLGQARTRLALPDRGPYTPDLDSAFPLGALPEKRTLTPEEAREACPSGRKGWLFPLQAEMGLRCGPGPCYPSSWFPPPRKDTRAMNLLLLFAGYVFTVLAAALAQYTGISRAIVACGVDLESREAMAMRTFAAATWPGRGACAIGCKLLGRRTLVPQGEAEQIALSLPEIALGLSPLARDANGVIFSEVPRDRARHSAMK